MAWLLCFHLRFRFNNSLRILYGYSFTFLQAITCNFYCNTVRGPYNKKSVARIPIVNMKLLIFLFQLFIFIFYCNSMSSSFNKKKKEENIIFILALIEPREKRKNLIFVRIQFIFPRSVWLWFMYFPRHFLSLGPLIVICQCSFKIIINAFVSKRYRCQYTQKS